MLLSAWSVPFVTQRAFVVHTKQAHDQQADGVGGWAAEGVNPADFSHALCGYMARRALENDKSPFEVLLRPLDLMQAGYSDLTRDSTITAGGSTATVAVARANGRMDIAK